MFHHRLLRFRRRGRRRRRRGRREEAEQAWASACEVGRSSKGCPRSRGLRASREARASPRLVPAPRRDRARGRVTRRGRAGLTCLELEAIDRVARLFLAVGKLDGRHVRCARVGQQRSRGPSSRARPAARYSSLVSGTPSFTAISAESISESFGSVWPRMVVPRASTSGPPRARALRDSSAT